MSDSVITLDEQALLDLMNPPADTSKISSVDTPEASGSTLPGVKLNQQGRWRMIYTTMALGNGLYGFGLPYLLHAEDGKTYAGFQLVAAATGFYLSYNATQNMDLPVGRVVFIEKGGALALTSFFVLQSMIGFENWFEFDPEFRGALAYMMVATPVGAYYGDKLYKRWKPSDGQAVLINAGATLGSINGVALHRLLLGDLDVDTERAFENSYRAFVLLAYGGNLAGMYYTHQKLGENSFSMGDTYLVQGTALLGAYVAGHLISISDLNNEKAIILLAMSAVNTFAWKGVGLTKDVDFSEGDAAIIALGTIAANGIWRGLDIMMDSNISSDAASTLDIVTSLTGFYTTYRSVKARRTSSGVAPETGSSGFFKLRLSPTLMGDFERMTPGISLQLNF